jgi:hypothetical protein
VVRRYGGALALLALVAWCPPPAAGQSLSVTTAGDAVKIRAPGWSFLTAEPLARLREGRTVRVELAAFVLSGPGRSPLTAVRQVFSVSYDLWEERFAVATAGAHAASVSHLAATAAEAWCIDQLAVPIAPLAALPERRFWIRLEYRILDGDGAATADDDSGLTLQRLIDVFSRRRKNESQSRALEGGPFRLPR